MRILVTGATGLLGNNLVRILLEDGHQVTGTIRNQAVPKSLNGLDVETVFCDLAKPHSVSQVVDSFDAVVHAAATINIGWSKLAESRSVNVEGTRQLARAARLKNIRMIHVSTVDALAAGSWDRLVTEAERETAKSACSYVVSKREAEEVIAEEVELGLDGIIVQPGFMVGPWDWRPSSGEMMLSIARYWTPLAPAGGCSVVDVRDVACGIASAIEHGNAGENYILAGKNMSYYDLWCLMAKISGARGPIGKLPQWINSTAGWFGDLRYRFSGVEPNVNSAATAMGQLVHWYSSEKAERALGYEIGDVDDALADAWHWFQQFGYVR